MHTRLTLALVLILVFQIFSMTQFGGIGTNILFQNALGQIPASQSQSHTVPNWIKNSAKWWSDGTIGDSDFIKSIQYLIQQGIIVVPTTQVSSNPSQGIPSWVKNSAKWWSEGQIDDSDFIKSVQYLVQNGIISTQVADQVQAAVTDHNGIAIFQINNQNVQFKFVNETTGQPLAGANIVLSVDSQTQSVGTLLVIDPSNHYPVQVIVLIPSETSSITPTSLKNYFIPSASAQSEQVVQVLLTTNVRQAGNILPVSFLHKVVHQVGEKVENLNIVYDSLALALKYADKNGLLPVSKYLQNHGYETGSIPADEVIDKIKEENKQGKVIDGLFLIGSAGETLPAYMLSRVVGETTAKMDISTVSGCHSQQVQYVEVGPAIFYNCPTDKTAGLVKYDPPAETNHVSLDIFSQANEGFGERIQADKGQSVPVPAGDYSVTVSAPGKNPITEDVTITPEKITDVTAVPPPIPNNAMTTTITPARDLSGHYSGSFSMKDTTSDGCSFSGTWQATFSQDGNDLTGTFVLVSASSPDYPTNDFCTLIPNDDFPFQGTVSSSSFSISGSDFSSKGSFTTDLIRGTFNECSDESCAAGSFTGMRTG